MRRVHANAARAALSCAAHTARLADIPALTAEVESAARVLNAPAARLTARGGERLLTLDEVEVSLASKVLVVDACRHVVRHAGNVGTRTRTPLDDTTHAGIHDDIVTPDSVAG